ncbi:hypothetical protein LCGC14_0238870 [marine sediment metagenome]|uniref:Uncharacterized protein n=1 Tax=marine sediment metagenome TaxID=412755 RepID=A0A0F9U836_9ZZZZ|nr:ATP-binding cassette domain-containing protein [Phycisphaerae bacterium]HDZ43769.1 ATP-binding cassette domain-containing protein [Phycisphaerae bacterium]
MQNFFRSLRYLRPYRTRLAISIGCVIVIAGLWGGGLAMMLPATKALISPEGLHGWAYNAITQNMLGIRLVRRDMPATTGGELQKLSIIIDVVAVDDDGPAAQAGIKQGQWLIGLGEAGEYRLIRGDILADRLASMAGNGVVSLAVFDPNDPDRSDIKLYDVHPAKVGFSTRAFRWMTSVLPKPHNFRDRFKVLLWLFALTLAMTWLRNILRFFQEYLVQTAVFSGIRDLRCQNYGVVLRLPMTFYSSHGTTDTMSRFLADMGELSRGQVTLFGKTMVEPAKALAALGAALLCSWQVTLLALIAGPPAFVLIHQFGKVMKRASKRALESHALLIRSLDETLTGLRVIKAYTMESAERKRFYRVNRRLIKQQRRMARIDSATSPSVEALGITAALAAGGMAGWWVFNDQMDSARFLAMMVCLGAMFDPVRKLAKVATRFQRAEAAATRVFELHDQPQEVRIPNAPDLPPHRESIEFRDVSLRYPSAETDAVADVNLTIHHGETLAIVGPNGCGKTTLVSLLPRLLEPTGGHILIDGQEIATVSLRSLRKQIGLVTQDTILFYATIGENIAYGLRRPDEAAVLAAAKRAYVDEFVRDLPDGYDTMVGEHGATLSGGQRQRIAIARAILRDPAIMIFDEATSQIDANSEHRIHQAMEDFTRGRTTIMIAHRFATIMSADRIVAMDAGRIIDVGSHEELMQRCSLYAHLYRTQFEDTGGPAS